MSVNHKSILAYMRLFRLPNLFTVPGDPVAGFLLASGGTLSPQLLPLGAAALALYMAGLALNDVVDRRKDAELRPNRPIPSGAVSPRMATTLAVLGFVTGDLLAFAAGGWRTLLAALALTGLILLYNLALKRYPFPGSLCMGCCRAGSVFLGASCFGTANVAALGLMAFMVVYIASLTAAAFDEEHKTRADLGAFALPAVLALTAAAALLLPWPPPGQMLCAALALAIALCDSLRSTLRLHRGTISVPANIGQHIRALILVQGAAAAYALALPYDILAVVDFGLLWLVAQRAGARFYGS